MHKRSSLSVPYLQHGTIIYSVMSLRALCHLNTFFFLTSSYPINKLYSFCPYSQLPLSSSTTSTPLNYHCVSPRSLNCINWLSRLKLKQGIGKAYLFRGKPRFKLLNDFLSLRTPSSGQQSTAWRNPDLWLHSLPRPLSSSQSCLIPKIPPTADTSQMLFLLVRTLFSVLFYSGKSYSSFN